MAQHRHARGDAVTIPSDPEVISLERQFHDETMAGYRHLVRTINYQAKAFLHMVAMNGGVGAAHLLLQTPNISAGFTTLWEANMLEHSIEALALKPEYRPLFSDAELEAARRRLIDYGFDVETYLSSLTP
ncbi:hypothetical protein [Saccharothrix sp. HUAS TT1]|uniref:hypothetical protein n=1 Tax=unclassified Saccharothrix TaxID=2593673 RepID=UPI00345B8CC2